MSYSTGGDPALVHLRLIAVGGFGEVHEVRSSCHEVLNVASFPDQTIKYRRFPPKLT
jgi:hypothetical protein